MNTAHEVANEDLLDWLGTVGAWRYGLEAVSQLQHALQCAHLAEIGGASDALVAACLLHDIGHLVQNDLHEPTVEDHSAAGARFLAQWFDLAVTEPVRLHAEAKRWLVVSDLTHFSTLSAASKRSLQWQGGAMTEVEAQAFVNRPYARDAIALRRWDDRAKDPNVTVPPLAHYRALLDDLLQPVDFRRVGR